MDQTVNDPVTEAAEDLPIKALTLDFEFYDEMLAKEDIPQDQRREFLETLWSIMVSFVDLGFEIHPLQQACGQNGEDAPGELAFDPVDMVAFDQENSAENTTNNAARPFSAAAERKEI